MLEVPKERKPAMKKCHYSGILLLITFSLLFAQGQPPALEKAEQKTVIDSVCANLEREYIFPDATKKYVAGLKKNLRSGKYDEVTDPREFAAKLSEDLAAIHRDDHLRIMFNLERIKIERQSAQQDEAAIVYKKRQERINNYGFEEIRILPGNIGYLKFNSFSEDPDSYPIAIGTMNFLANADAVIIDLRQNGGGEAEMVQFLCSYFLDNPRKLLNSFFYRKPDTTTQYWSYTYLPGKRLDKVDLYLLTSKNTFSAAEEFCYNLKNMKRATVIGETTGGGAHNNKFVILNDHFMMSLPFARAYNPITKTNWEGVGVEPDIKVESEKALETAQAMAAKKLSEKEENPKFKNYYSWTYEGYQAELNPVTISPEVMESYVGTYGPRTITLEDGTLYYQRAEGPKMKLIPLREDYFGFTEIDYFRLKFIKEGDKVVAVEGYTPDGLMDKHLKDK
jgi:C-terminal processing protease CtpA/Prc